MSTQPNHDQSLPAQAAGPMPLGLAGLAITLALFGSFNAGKIAEGSFPMAGMMLTFGGLVVLIAAILAFVNRNEIALTLFGTFSALWFTLGAIFFSDSVGHPLVASLSGSGFTWFWFVWAVTGTYLWLASVRTNIPFSTFVGLVAAMFWCLWLGQLTAGHPGTGWIQVAGFVGWAAGVIAGYTAFAEMLNNVLGRIVLPEFGHESVAARAH